MRGLRRWSIVLCPERGARVRGLERWMAATGVVWLGLARGARRGLGAAHGGGADGKGPQPDRPRIPPRSLDRCASAPTSTSSPAPSSSSPACRSSHEPRPGALAADFGHVLTCESQLPLADGGLSGGRCCPDATSPRGTYYMVTHNMSDGGNFHVTATDPAGPWSEPIWVRSRAGSTRASSSTTTGRSTLNHRWHGG